MDGLSVLPPSPPSALLVFLKVKYDWNVFLPLRKEEMAQTNKKWALQTAEVGRRDLPYRGLCLIPGRFPDGTQRWRIL